MKLARVSQALTLAALALMLALILWPPLKAWHWLAALPLAILFVSGLRPRPRWGGWVATLMIPYLGIGVMNLLAGPATPLVGLLLSIGSALACFAALYWTRCMGFSLRR